ncbi:MAG: ATP-binding cassette domain-containing protein [Limnobacter sp.]|nr:ATP-binding cassette domain-containing protein [Limnobacter sp.]
MSAQISSSSPLAAQHAGPALLEPQILKEALAMQGLQLQVALWSQISQEFSSLSEGVEAYLRATKCAYTKLNKVSHKEFAQLEQGTLCGFTDGSIGIKKNSTMASELAWAIEFGPIASSGAADPEPLGLFEFWQRLRNTNWLVQAIRASFPSFMPIIAVSMLINILAMAPAIFSIQVYDRIMPNKAFASLWALALGVVVCLVFEFLLKRARHGLLEHAATVTDALCSQKMASTLLGTPVNTTRASTLLQHLRSFESLREMITGVFLITLVDVPFMAIFLLVMAFIHPYFLVVALFFIGISFTHLFFSHRRLSRLGLAQLLQLRESQNRWIETLSSLPTLQSLGIQRSWSKRLTMQQVEQRIAGNEIRAAVFHSGQFIYALQQLGWISMICLGVWLSTLNELTVGGMIAASMLAMRCFSPLQRLQNQLLHGHVAQAGFIELDQFMSKRSGPQPSLPLDAIRAIQLTNCSVQFENKTALREINLQVKAGEKVGLIGPNGAGKSTLLNLLAGILPSASGGYCINELPVDQIGPAELGSRVGYSEQPPCLIEGTLLQNIQMDRPWVSLNDCRKAIEALGLADWVHSLPQGLHSQVTVGGKNLSAGKRQMISLARAFAGEPDLLLLDEPTVCLDQEHEHRVMEAIRRVRPDQTLVLATHRLGLLKLVDTLVLLDQGCIKQQGNRAEVLVQTGGKT